MDALRSLVVAAAEDLAIGSAANDMRMFSLLAANAGLVHTGTHRPEVRSKGLSVVALSRLPAFIAAQPCVAYEPCCICIEPMTAGQRLVALECAHLFHHECIRRWLGVQAACPLCKRDPGASLGV